ncbi:MAG: 5'-nucleotidase C-terminal domain-containing protein [Clostridia bacterium]|nr:5'-nucleotidase C-terminal domain-containing protein [Clostridia bacterium]
MKKYLLSAVTAVCLIGCLLCGTAFAKDTESIVILYENDVHCAVEGYSKLAAMKQELKEEYEYVGVVSSGDFVQGETIGAVSKGEYIVNIMNIVGYDAIIPGNHEFGYMLPRLVELNAISNTKYLSCNFMKLGEDKPYFDPYKIVSYGETDIAYIGIVTPETINSSYPSQFKNEDGEIIYTFSVNNLYEVVQSNVDAARKEGADYVIALAHVGYDESQTLDDIVKLIGNTDGIDIVLDGHSHSTIEEMLVKDKSGDEVLLTSTGTKFKNIGKLTITKDGFDTQLIPTESYTKTDAAVDAYIKEINESYAELGNRKIGESKVELIVNDSEGNRLVRRSVTNLGNLCADAFRAVIDTEIAFVNGGGIRAPIKAGDVTFNTLYSVFPFGNQVLKAELSGQVLLDMLEMGVMEYPNENGSFPHMSGVTFKINKSIPTPIKVDETGFFVKVEGDYRVYDVMILDGESGTYKPLELDRNYTIAIANYYVIDFGGGLSMLEKATVLQNDGILDVEVLESYVANYLGGVIGEEYAEVDNRIIFTDGYDKAASEDKGITRAEAIIALWNIEGSPVANYAMKFEDVRTEESYTEAIRWAAAAKIVNGYSESSFAPNELLTREQLATILWRYAKYKNADVSVGESTNILSYDDAFEISEYAIPAFQWSCGSGVLSGNTVSTLAPKNAVSEDELKAVLDRYSQNVKS